MPFGCQTLKSLDIKGLRMNPLFCSIQGRKRVLNGILGRTRGEQTPIMQITPTWYRILKKAVISMTETEKKFDAIRRAYPETISKEQLYQIAHISKATALHLLQNGLIPCKDTGKKTRRYTIRTDDVITYLIDREIRPEKYGAPDHWYRDRSGYRKSRNTFRYELSSLSEIEKKLFEEYVQTELVSYGDLLSVEETMEITGYSSTAIYRWCNAKKLVGFKISGKFIIPKIGLAEFLISPYSCGIQRKSWRHLLFVSTFLKKLRNLDGQLP